MRQLTLTAHLLFVVGLTSCDRNKPFDRTGWNNKVDWGVYPEREEMLDDLLRQHAFTGQPLSKVQEQLGSPDLIQHDSVGYLIAEEYGWDVDPVRTKYLYLVYNADSLITATKVHEWKH